ncbi:hypothetical protein IIA95_03820 [Patescibacteria group bacterium]|nr:hypothetical protein [Patescibacteria group bacterium]
MENLVLFLNTNMFTGLATILTGGVVILVYFRQKRDSKIQAAKVLLTEIRTAEEKLSITKEKLSTGNSNDLPTSIIQSNNWKKYSHLFVSDFDQDELKLISSFYENGELVEDFARKKANHLWITTEERARVTVQKIAKYVDESLGKDDPSKYVADRELYLTKGMDAHNVPYSPKVTTDRIKTLLEGIETITTSSAGVKLKKLANLTK